MGHIAHPRNSSNQIIICAKNYDYVDLEKKKRKMFSFLISEWSSFLQNLNSLYSRMLCVDKVEIGTVVQEKKIFIISSIYHSYFINISPWNFHYSRMLCAKFVWNRPSGSLEDDCQWFFRHSLEKRRGPLFEQTWIPFTQRLFVSSLVEICTLVFEKKTKMWKVNDSADDDDDGQQTNFEQKSSLALSAQVSLKKKENISSLLIHLHEGTCINIQHSIFPFYRSE